MIADTKHALSARRPEGDTLSGFRVLQWQRRKTLRKIILAVLVSATLVALWAAPKPKGKPEQHVSPPKNVLIGKTIWQLKEVVTIPDQYVGSCQGAHWHEKGDEFSGMTDFTLKTIFVQRQPNADELDTVLHELSHATGDPEWECGKMTGHEAIYEIASRLASVLRQNEALARYVLMASTR